MFPCSTGKTGKLTHLGALFAAFGIVSLLAFGQPASATVMVDGVRDSNDTYDGSFNATWYNGHKPEFSIYLNGDVGNTTEVFFAEDTDNYYLYIAVPLYAKNMLWGLSALASGAMVGDVFVPDIGTEDPIADYRGQFLHHEKDGIFEELVMDFGKATGSEKVIFADRVIFAGRTFNLQNDNTDNTIVLQTSLDFLFKTPNPVCSVADCNAVDTQMAFELAFSKSENSDIGGIISSKSLNLEFHLSPERRADRIDPNLIPLPAALPLYGTGLAVMGLIGWRKRRKAAALA